MIICIFFDKIESICVVESQGIDYDEDYLFGNRDRFLEKFEIWEGRQVGIDFKLDFEEKEEKG